MTVLWYLLNLVLFTFGVLLAMKALDFAKWYVRQRRCKRPIGDGGGSHGRIARTSIDGLEGPIC